MDESRYDSAQFIITRAFTQSELRFSELDLYYLHSFESEIMYYNALFEQGLNSAYRTLSLATTLKNDTLIGNSENLIGLFYMNLSNFKDAIGHFERAVNLIPAGHINTYLAYKYHANANLAECFLKVNEPDSAIYYSKASFEEAYIRQKKRGTSLATWNIAEAHILKKELREAINLLLTELSEIDQSSHRDVVQMYDCSLMKVYDLLNMKDSSIFWMNNGLKEMDNPLNTDLSRKDFLECAVSVCIRQKDLETGSVLLEKLNVLTRSINGKEQNQRLEILKDYYVKNQRLVIEKELNEAQKKELHLRRTVESILMLLAALFLLLIFITYRTFRQRQKIAELNHSKHVTQVKQELELKSLKGKMKALNLERNRIASDLHDDIGAALSSIRIYSLAASKQMKSNPGESQNLLNKITESSSDMMERMSDIVWSINPKNDTGESLIIRMKTLASEVLGSMNIDLVYRIDPDVEKLKPTLAERKNIYLIFKEAINNIAKYSEANKVEITLTRRDDYFAMKISDNGKGFNINQAFTGNGLNNMSQRASSLNAYFHISSHRSTGTQIEFRMNIARISDSVVS